MRILCAGCETISEGYKFTDLGWICRSCFLKSEKETRYRLPNGLFCWEPRREIVFLKEDLA